MRQLVDARVAESLKGVETLSRENPAKPSPPQEGASLYNQTQVASENIAGRIPTFTWIAIAITTRLSRIALCRLFPY